MDDKQVGALWHDAWVLGCDNDCDINAVFPLICKLIEERARYRELQYILQDFGIPDAEYEQMKNRPPYRHPIPKYLINK